MNTQSAVNKKPCIILHGNNFDQNRGCQALRLTTQKICDRYLPEYARLHANIFRNEDHQFHTVEPDPHSAGLHWEIRNRYSPWLYLWGIKLVRTAMFGWFPPLEINRKLRESSAILALGGDNLSFDYGLLPVLMFFSPFAQAVRLGVPSVIWAASIGPFSQKPFWEKKFAGILRSVDLITVRESLTQKYLASIGVTENVRMVSDPAFLLEAEPVSLPAPLESALKSGAIGLNLAPLISRYSGQSASRWQASALGMLTHLAEKMSEPIVLIPHVMMSPAVFPANDDFLFLRQLHEACPAALQKKIVLYDACAHTCKQIKYVISRCRVFAGNRTHATIAALSSGVPTLSLGYSVKSRGINLDLFGHENFLAHFSELTNENLSVKLSALMQAEDDVRSHLKNSLPKQIEQAWLNGAYLREMLIAKGQMKS